MYRESVTRCERSSLRVIGMTWFYILYVNQTVHLTTALGAICSCLLLVCYVRISHGACTIDGNNFHDASLTLKNYFGITLFETLAFYNVWRICDALRKRRYACNRKSLLPFFVCLWPAALTNFAMNHSFCVSNFF